MNTFLLIMQSVPAILAAIKAVENAMPISGAGKAKLDAVIALVTTANAALSGAIPQLTSIIGAFVDLFNKVPDGWVIDPPALPLVPPKGTV